MFSLEKYIMQRVYVIYVSSFSLDYFAIQYLVQTIQIQRKRERQRRWDREKERSRTKMRYLSRLTFSFVVGFDNFFH